jgi:hypothetical protein
LLVLSAKSAPQISSGVGNHGSGFGVDGYLPVFINSSSHYILSNIYYIHSSFLNLKNESFGYKSTTLEDVTDIFYYA